jgi:DNA-binding transcriptional LysR family regulator
MDLAHLKMFYIIAREGSLTKAAHILHTSQSSLSRTLQTLEYYAKTQLFERHARGLKLTPQGEKVFHHAQKMVQEHEAFKKALFEDPDIPQGILKILTTPGMGSIWLTEYIGGFLDRYPEIQLDITVSLTGLEKTIEEVDLLIRTRIEHHPNLIQRCIMSNDYKLWASPEYLQKFGTPQAVEDLDHHRLLVFERAKFNVLANNYWILEIGSNVERPRQPFLVMNSLEGLITCAKKGLGIIGLPKEIIELRNRNKQLINILEDISSLNVDIYCIYDSKKQKSQKIKLFIEYLEEMMRSRIS